MGRWKMGLFLSGAFFGSLVLGVGLFASYAYYEREAIVLLAFALFIWLGSMFSIVKRTTRDAGRGDRSGGQHASSAAGQVGAGQRPSMEGGINSNGAGHEEMYPATAERDRTFSLMAAFIPGLGHFQLGLMQRGLGFVALFFGLGILAFFMTAMALEDDFLLLLIGLPFIWVYSLFDYQQQANKRARGEVLVDRTVFEDFQHGQEGRGLNKMLAVLLSMFPGAGHMYLGLQKRGFQLMAAFLLTVYLTDALRLSLFLFLIPLLWFYSFFDSLQFIAKAGKEPLKDEPLVEELVHRKRWIGWGLFALGLYYLVDQVLIRSLGLLINEHLSNRIIRWYDGYFQLLLVSLLMIGGGLRLLRGGGKRKEQRKPQ
ncbi:hypothetical protein [Paenibacillus sp. YYML68]|uniref:hypothetical protein n=1 Tax=Paenibacillus sp. YYML68 TaxID=2909250 RepID=UPI002491A77D|nr:hypothetical protein [Paenibacillus sp. YYML68]